MKYISDILSKISRTQRMMALILLLLTMNIIYLGPRIIDTLHTSGEEYEERIDKLNIRISVLEHDVEEYSSLLISEKRKCTDEILYREQEIIQMIRELQGGLRMRERSLSTGEPAGQKSMGVDVVGALDMIIKSIEDDK